MLVAEGVAIAEGVGVVELEGAGSGSVVVGWLPVNQSW